jgi:hypothetical protein
MAISRMMIIQHNPIGIHYHLNRYTDKNVNTKYRYKYIFFSRWCEDGRDRAAIECVIGDIRNRRRQAHTRQSLVI